MNYSDPFGLCPNCRNELSSRTVEEEVRFQEELTPNELDLIMQLNNYPQVLAASAREFSPATLANYAFDLAKSYNKFYHEEPILVAETEMLKTFRLAISAATARVIAKSMGLLGISVPERM